MKIRQLDIIIFLLIGFCLMGGFVGENKSSRWFCDERAEPQPEEIQIELTYKWNDENLRFESTDHSDPDFRFQGNTDSSVIENYSSATGPMVLELQAGSTHRNIVEFRDDIGNTVSWVDKNGGCRFDRIYLNNGYIFSERNDLKFRHIDGTVSTFQMGSE